MKGVEAVIAIVLILMITVALAAMSYVWFTDVFKTLTDSGDSAIADTGDKLQASFTVESARYTSANNVSVSIRNTGNSDIELGKIAFYLKGIPAATVSAPTGTLGGGDFTTTAFVVSNITSGIGAVCPGPSTLTVTIAQGQQQSATVSCS